jgi:hypothetical protein
MRGSHGAAKQQVWRCAAREAQSAGSMHVAGDLLQDIRDLASSLEPQTGRAPLPKHWSPRAGNEDLTAGPHLDVMLVQF